MCRILLVLLCHPALASLLLGSAAPSSLKEANDGTKSNNTACAGKQGIPGLKVFYINQDNQKDRQQCLDRQLREQCLEGERFTAIDYDRNPWQLRLNPQYKDCFAGGIDHSKVITHGSWSDFNLWKKSGRILANWCSHYRLMHRVQKHKELLDGSKDMYEYFLMLEDDVLLHKTDFVPVLKDFIDNYKERNWDLVQLDAFGPHGQLERQDEIKKGYVDMAKLPSFRGKDVFMPRDGDGFWGFQAVLVKVASLPKLLEKMRRMPVVPIDWLHKRVNVDHFKNLTALTFQAGITRNPEQDIMKDAGNVVQMIEKPDYCNDSIFKSSIR